MTCARDRRVRHLNSFRLSLGKRLVRAGVALGELRRTRSRQLAVFVEELHRCAADEAGFTASTMDRAKIDFFLYALGRDGKYLPPFLCDLGGVASDEAVNAF